MTDVTERIAKYKELLDSGALTQEEFEALKAKALAEELGWSVVAEPEATEAVEPDVAETTEPDVVEMQQETSDANEETTAENPQPEATQTEAQATEPVTVTFTIEGNRLFPEVEGADGSKYKDGFIKPKGQSVNSFCAEVAEMMERDMGRLVRYRFAGTRKKAKGGGQTPEERRKGIVMTLVAVAIVLGIALAWNMFSNRVVYKGDVRGLVEHCQTMGSRESQIVEVTGYVWQVDDVQEKDYVTLSSDGTLSGYTVRATLAGPARTRKGSRMTLIGRVDGSSVTRDGVWLRDVRIVN